MKLRAWWTSYPRLFDIKSVEDTTLSYIKNVTYWHPDYLRYETISASEKNIIY